jgi:hypothetical protein
MLSVKRAKGVVGSMLKDYTDQQSRVATAFSFGGSLCTAHCEACGRTYFVTSDGHGDYEEGELEELYEKAKKQPHKYIEVPDYSSVATMYMPGPSKRKEVVVGCECDPTKPLSDFIEEYASQLTCYLQEYWKENRSEAVRRKTEADQAIRVLGWIPMEQAPKDATWVEVQTVDGDVVKAHWASDTSGEEQPPFEGWFMDNGGSHFTEVKPVHWRPLKDESVDNA